VSHFSRPIDKKWKRKVMTPLARRSSAKSKTSVPTRHQFWYNGPQTAAVLQPLATIPQKRLLHKVQNNQWKGVDLSDVSTTLFHLKEFYFQERDQKKGVKAMVAVRAAVVSSEREDLHPTGAEETFPAELLLVGNHRAYYDPPLNDKERVSYRPGESVANKKDWERARAFAKLAGPLVGSDQYNLVLDSVSQRNIRALEEEQVGRGTIVVDRDTLTALYHHFSSPFAARPLIAIWTGAHQRKAKGGFESYFERQLFDRIPELKNSGRNVQQPVTDQIGSLYADFCGDVSAKLIKCLDIARNLKIHAVTQGKRNTKRRLPDRDVVVKSFDQARVRCNIYVKTRP
jgi:hypothetical protein